MEAALEAGADDVVERADGIDVVTAPAQFEPVKASLAAHGFEPSSAEISMEPTTTVALTGKDAEQMLRIADSLEDLDDVQNFYANFDIAEDEMARLV